MNVTEPFAEYGASQRWSDLPAAVRTSASMCLSDWTATVIAALGAETSQAVVTSTRHWAGGGGCTAIGLDSAYAAEAAAYINAFHSEILEIGHGHARGGGHLGGPTIPAALALAEERGLSGQELLRAVVIGYDIFGKVGGASHPSMLNRGYISSGLCGCLGAASAAATVLGLAKSAFGAALGIAAYLAPVSLLSGYYGTVNSGETAQAAWQGVLAARLATAGLAGSADPLAEFCEQFGDPARLREAISRLGQDYEITNLYFKLFPGCRLTHGPAEALLNILRRHPLEPKEIREIKIRVTPAAVLLCGSYTDPAVSFVRAQFSIPFVAATAVLYGSVDAQAFSGMRIAHEAIHDFARRVVRLEEGLSEDDVDIAGAEVEVLTSTGARYGTKIDHPRGSPGNPATERDLMEKFARLTEPRVGRSRAEQLWQTLRRFDQLSGAEVTTFLAGAVSSAVESSGSEARGPISGAAGLAPSRTGP